MLSDMVAWLVNLRLKKGDFAGKTPKCTVSRICFFQTSSKSKSKILPFIRSWWCQRFRNVYLGIINPIWLVESKSKQLINAFFLGISVGFWISSFAREKNSKKKPRGVGRCATCFFWWSPGGPVVRWSLQREIILISFCAAVDGQNPANQLR